MGKGIVKEDDQIEDNHIDGDQDQKVVITMRCMDMASPTSNVDKVPCSECGEMTWLSTSFRKMKVDKIVCNPCFLKSGRHEDEDYCMCVTEECLDEAFVLLESHGIRTTKEEMIRIIEDNIGKKLVVTKIKEVKRGI